ncbi:hypothetical protein M758_6G018800 [Ceratodon purpureus]|nr:hypothetical protein M758_6G018800 [Ceratodon purpureus]
MEGDVRLPKRLRTMEGMVNTRTDEFANYDVFISHRGPDTKSGFVGFLYKDLVAAGLQPFLDCKSIDIGDDSWDCIEHAIKRTPLALVVFSESFAQSEWCLRELHVMLHTPSVKVLPVFYNVRPSEVRFPESGRLKDGFEKLASRHHHSNIIEQWRADLDQASKIMGWEHSPDNRRLEVDLVKVIVGKVCELAKKPLPLDVGEYVVGVEQVAVEIMEKLDKKKHVLMLGLWGMGGIGKSTLAKELYNQMRKMFVVSCFIEDVTNKVSQAGGVVKVQNRILKSLCTNESSKIEDKSAGKVILEETLSKKKLLLVLDDVHDEDGDNGIYYWISRKMLAEGSMCIITSRNSRVFEKLNSFDINREVYIHNVQRLNIVDSKRMFSSFAFGGYWTVKQGFEEMVENISNACGGVPLVLKVCGSLLKHEENVKIWEEVLKKLNSGRIMDQTSIFDCLQISYNFLPKELQEMFLDISCALLGKPKDWAMRVWNSHHISPTLGLRTLTEKALVTVDMMGCLSMHDHLRDMGREIARKKRIHEGVIRRLWMPESLTLLKKNEESFENLQTLMIYNNDLNTRASRIDLDISHMKDLFILICDDSINLVQSLPKNLTWLIG